LSSADWTTFSGKVGGSGASGQVAYWTGASAQAGSNNLFWDNANGRLGIGTNAPSEPLTISTNINSANGIRVTNSNTGNIARSQITLINNSGNQGNLSIWCTGTGLANKVLFESSKDFIIGTDSTVASGGTSKFQIYVAGYNNVTSPQFTLHGTANLSLGSTTDSGERLQVTGDVKIVGSGATSGTRGLTILNSSSTNLFRFRNDGSAIIGSNIQLYPYSSSAFTVDSAGRFVTIQYGAYGAASTGYGVYLVNSGAANREHTSGDGGTLALRDSFTVASGTGTFNVLNIIPTINQTGLANGITRGLYVNPTLTAAADFRAIETSRGNVVFGNLPTSSAGLPTGAIWNDAGTIKIV
jgi:hypothetical protein